MPPIALLQKGSESKSQELNQPSSLTCLPHAADKAVILGAKSPTGTATSSTDNGIAHQDAPLPPGAVPVNFGFQAVSDTEELPPIAGSAVPPTSAPPMLPVSDSCFPGSTAPPKFEFHEVSDGQESLPIPGSVAPVKRVLQEPHEEATGDVTSTRNPQDPQGISPSSRGSKSPKDANGLNCPEEPPLKPALKPSVSRIEDEASTLPVSSTLSASIGFQAMRGTSSGEWGKAASRGAKKSIFQAASNVFSKHYQAAPQMDLRSQIKLRKLDKKMHRVWSEEIWMFLEEPESSPAAQAWTLAIGACIAMSVLSASLQTIDVIPFAVLIIADFAFDCLFSLEILVRFLTCPCKKRFLLNFYNMVDVLCVSSLLQKVIAGFDQPPEGSKSQAAMLTWPVLRLLKASRNFAGFRLLVRAIQRSVQALPVPLSMLVMIVVGFAGLLYHVEPRDNVRTHMHSMWLVLLTISTVGYSDAYARTDSGKGVLAAVQVFGVFYMALPLSIMGNNFMAVWMDRDAVLLMDKTKQRLVDWGFSADDMEIAFQFFDEDDNGELDEDEFHDMMRELNLGIPEARVLELFDWFDSDGSGTISANEFIRHMFPQAWASDYMGRNSGQKNPLAESLMKSMEALTKSLGMDALTRRASTTDDEPRSWSNANKLLKSTESTQSVDELGVGGTVQDGTSSQISTASANKVGRIPSDVRANLASTAKGSRSMSTKLRGITKEVKSGATKFVENEDEEMVREVQVCNLRVVAPSGQVLLQRSEKAPPAGDGEEERKTKVLKKMPGTKRMPGESIWATVERLLKKDLPSMQEYLEIDYTRLEDLVEERESARYGGLMSRYVTTLAEVHVKSKVVEDEAVRTKIGLGPEGGVFTLSHLDGRELGFEWVSLDYCVQEGIPVRGTPKEKDDPDWQVSPQEVGKSGITDGSSLLPPEASSDPIQSMAKVSSNQSMTAKLSQSQRGVGKERSTASVSKVQSARPMSKIHSNRHERKPAGFMGSKARRGSTLGVRDNARRGSTLSTLSGHDNRKRASHLSDQPSSAKTSEASEPSSAQTSEASERDSQLEAKVNANLLRIEQVEKRIEAIRIFLLEST